MKKATNMKNTVLIKLYRNNIINGDWHDMNLDEFPKKIAALRKYGKKIGKNVSFTVCQALDKCTQFDCFAEIIYDGELSEEEKSTYVDAIKFYARDAYLGARFMEEYTLKCPIALIKAKIELL